MLTAIVPAFGLVIGYLTPALRRGVGVVAVAVAIGAGAAVGGHPSGNGVEDAILRAALVTLFVVAPPPRDGRPDIVLGVAATVCALGSVWAGFGGLATGMAIKSRTAVARAALALCLLHLRYPSTTRGTAVVALLAVVMVVGPSAVRHWRIAAAAAAVAAAASLLSAVAALRAQRLVNDGVREATTAITQGRGGDTVGAAAGFARSAGLFHRAAQRLDAWWAKPGHLVPVVAQQARVATALSHDGTTVARAAHDAASAADPSLFRMRGGHLDLAAIGSLKRPVDAAVAVITTVRVDAKHLRSPWLTPPVDHLLDRVDAKLRAANEQAHTLDAVVTQLPGLLGRNGPRHYFLALTTLSEARGIGGFMGNWGELTVDQGSIHLARFGRISQLDNFPHDIGFFVRALEPTPDYFHRYGGNGIQYRFDDAALTPDFPTMSRVISAIYPYAGGEPVDGVICLDPIALSGLLRLSGPVSVAGWPTPITADNAASILLHDEYDQLSEDRRIDFLSDVAHAVLQQLTQADLPGPSGLIDALGPAVRDRNLMLYAERPDEEHLYALVHVDGAFPTPRSDGIGVIEQNLSNAKIDWYLRRTVSYHAVVGTTGAVLSTLDVSLDNAAPRTGETSYVIGPRGTNQMILSIYSPLALRDATFDGAPLTMKQETELGQFVYSTQLQIPAGTTSRLTLHLAGRVAVPYGLDVHRQPTALPETIETSASFS